MNRILHLVGLLKVRIRYLIYWLVDYPIYPGLHFRQYQKIFKSPDAQNGTATFQGKKIHYFDGPGFLANIKELFVDNCYYFETSNPIPRIIDCGAYIGLSIVYFKKLSGIYSLGVYLRMLDSAVLSFCLRAESLSV